ncbi:MAG: porin, partial [Muribaculaceae bacterium]|nr:porin [Muribaculaceae bacterium]
TNQNHFQRLIMTNYRLWAMLAFVVPVFGTTFVSAQNHPSNPQEGTVEILMDGTKDSVIYEVLTGIAPSIFNEPTAPRFAIVGKDRKFYLGIGGMVKGTVSYDWGNPIDNPISFVPALIPMSQPEGNGGLLQFSAATSNLFLEIVAMPGEKHQLGAYISANFRGENYGFRLRFAYVTYRGFTAGFNYSLFSDVAAAPPTIDYQGPCGLAVAPNGVLDYVYDINRHWKVAVGAELPIADATTDAYTYMVNQRTGDMPVYVQYSWGNLSWIRVSGILRGLMYHDIVDGRNHTCLGWGVKASGSAAVAERLRAFYEYSYGKGISNYIQDMNEAGLDMVPDAGCRGRLNTIAAWGMHAGLQYTFSKRLFVSSTYSMMRNYAPRYYGGSVDWSHQIRYSQYVAANAFWNITDNLQTGVEYLWGRRADMDGHRR